MDFTTRLIPPARDQVFAMEGYYVWGATCIGDGNGRYHLFACRWPKSSEFWGWISHGEIVRAEGERPEDPFEYRETLDVLKEAAWSCGSVIGPVVFKWEGAYYLAYTGMSLPDEPDPDMPFTKWRHLNRHRIRFRQHVGMASAPHPAGQWRPVSDAPVLSPRPGKWDEPFVTDPVACATPEGKILLVYKSSTERSTDPDKKEGGRLLLGLAMADQPGGPYRRVGREPLFEHYVEDPFIWHENGEYRMLAKDMTGAISGGRYGNGLLYASANGIDWELAAEKTGWEMRIDWLGEPAQDVWRMERPAVLVEDGHAICLYTAVAPSREMDEAWNLARRLRNVYDMRARNAVRDGE